MTSTLHPEIEIKSADAVPGTHGGVIHASADGYEYDVIASVTGVVDKVGDVPVPGVYGRSLGERLPRQIKGHDWNIPQGRYVSMEEYLPGDHRLPATTPQGKPWPSEAGALVGKVRLFKGTREGEEAKARWQEYGPDLQLSIGYVAKKATKDPRTGTRYLHDVDLFEVSEVLWGACPTAGPMPTALATKMLAGIELETKEGDWAAAPDGGDQVDVAALHVAAADEIDWDEVAAAAEQAPDDTDLERQPGAEEGEDTPPEDGDTPSPEDPGTDPVHAEPDAAHPDAEAGGQLDAGTLADAAELGVEIKVSSGSYVAPALGKQQRKKPPPQNSNGDFNSKHPRGATGTHAGGKFVAKGNAGSGDNAGLPADWVAQLQRADPRYQANAKGKGKGGGKGKGKKGRAAQHAAARAASQQVRATEMERRDRVEAVFEKDRAEEDTRRAAADEAANAASDKRVRAGMVSAETQRRREWQASWRARRATEAQVRRHWEAGQRQGRIAASEKAALEKKTLAAEPDVDQPHTYYPTADATACVDCDGSAETKGLHTDPDSVLAAFRWAEDQAWAADDLEVKAEGGMDQNRGNAENLRKWYLHGAGIPWGSPGDWAACVAIAGKHMRPDQAKGWCNLRHKDATGEYAGPNAHGGKGKSYSPEGLETKLVTWDPAAEVGPAAAHLPAPGIETKGYDSIPAAQFSGTLEAHREAVRAAVYDRLRGEEDDTGRYEWDSVHLLATFPDRAIAERCNHGEDEREVYEVPYTITEQGMVTLGELQPIVIRPVVEHTDRPEAGDTALDPAVALVADAARALESKTLPGGLETKAGRVLSMVNEKRLREAITHLLAVCGVAGVAIDLPSPRQAEDAQGPGSKYGDEPPYPPDTTSPGAREHKTVIAPGEVADALALLLPL